MLTLALVAEPKLGVRPVFVTLSTCEVLYCRLLCRNVSMNNRDSIFTTEEFMTETTLPSSDRRCSSCLDEQKSNLHTLPFEV